MDIKLANEIIACLPKDRTVFDYYKDRYAVMLLERLVADGMPIAEIKQTRYGKLLNRPLVKDVVAGRGDGVLTREDLIYAYPPSDVERYVLTLGVWGRRGDDRSWRQTSRRGTNLVLQLNFSRQHDAAYERLLTPVQSSPFIYHGHPVCVKGRTTMAWARIDIDFDAGEALIEEVQNDWIRKALGNYAYAQRVRKRYGRWAGNRILWHRRQEVGRLADMERYVKTSLLQHAGMWSEAMFAAAIWFLTEEIGISRIWYHDFETGVRLKKIGWSKPPRSLYTDLPKRFCFERTTAAPAFIADTAPRPLKRRIRDGKEHFWHMAA